MLIKKNMVVYGCRSRSAAPSAANATVLLRGVDRRPCNTLHAMLLVCITTSLIGHLLTFGGLAVRPGADGVAARSRDSIHKIYSRTHRFSAGPRGLEALSRAKAQRRKTVAAAVLIAAPSCLMRGLALMPGPLLTGRARDGGAVEKPDPRARQQPVTNHRV